MSLLDDARRLMDEGPPTFHAPACGHDVPQAAEPHEDCHYCGAMLSGALRQYLGEHAPDCPWLSMPKIVAALEAAERLHVAHARGDYAEDMEADIEALVAALKGEET